MDLPQGGGRGGERRGSPWGTSVLGGGRREEGGVEWWGVSIGDFCSSRREEEGGKSRVVGVSMGDSVLGGGRRGVVGGLYGEPCTGRRKEWGKVDCLHKGPLTGRREE